MQSRDGWVGRLALLLINLPILNKTTRRNLLGLISDDSFYSECYRFCAKLSFTIRSLLICEMFYLKYISLLKTCQHWLKSEIFQKIHSKHLSCDYCIITSDLYLAFCIANKTFTSMHEYNYTCYKSSCTLWIRTSSTCSAAFYLRWGNTFNPEGTTHLAKQDARVSSQCFPVAGLSVQQKRLQCDFFKNFILCCDMNAEVDSCCFLRVSHPQTGFAHMQWNKTVQPGATAHVNGTKCSVLKRSCRFITVWRRKR